MSSRVAKKPIRIPDNVQISMSESKLIAKGPKGQREMHINQLVEVICDSNANEIKVDASNDNTAIAGTTRALINNIMAGITAGFERKLVLVGVGYRAQVQGKNLSLTLGYSHPVNYPIPDNVTIETPQPTEIIVKGNDKQQVGQVAAEIRKFREPEPYKGKGIRYADEVISLKETKKK